METKYRILVVDDEEDIRDILAFNLSKQGYEVAQATNGEEALTIAPKFKPHLILMDVMMPQKDGIVACEEFRENPDFAKTLIVLLTARTEEFSEMAGYIAGADDYISKPIKPRILIKKIDAMFRREALHQEAKNTPEVIEIRDLILNKALYNTQKGSQSISLPKKEFELLFLLASNPNKIFKREEILTQIWGENIVVIDRTIDVHIRKLRKKIGDDYFVTIKGVGYKFNLD